MTNARDAVDLIIDRVGHSLVVGAPLGIGKPILLLDALYERARVDRSLEVEIITALTLSPPRPGSDLEHRLLDPILERVEGWVAPAYLADLESGRLPPNVSISEFYLRPGALVDADQAQLGHINANYSDVVRDCLNRGVNVIVQSLAIDRSGRLSLSSNPDVTLDLMAHMALDEKPILLVGVVNKRLPFLGGDAVVDDDDIDIMVDEHSRGPEPFPVPAEPVSLAEHAIGLQAAALIPDGGTIQLGIGSMADAVAAALILRDRDPQAFRAALERLGTLDRHRELIERWGGTGPFEVGLYGCSEMLSDALFGLYEAGIVRRRAFPNEAVQRLYDSGAIDAEVSPDTLRKLLSAGVIQSPLDHDDLALLASLGLVSDRCSLSDNGLVELPDGKTASSDLDSRGAVDELIATAPGPRMRAPMIHAAFYLGTERFYERLRELDPNRIDDINMTAVAFTNSLDRFPETKRAQRRDARFVNQAMKIAADGSVSAHSLANGRTLSGVGGHFDFVEMARRLPDARSITLLTSTHSDESNVVPQLAHVTIPGQNTDLVVTEHGIADLQSRTDGEVLDDLVSVCHQDFQDELVDFGQSIGKLPPGYRPSGRARSNTSHSLAERLGPLLADGLLTRYPFGSALTEVESDLVAALRALESMRDFDSLPGADELRAAWSPPQGAQHHLARMGLNDPDGVRERLMQRAVVAGLASAGVIDPA